MAKMHWSPQALGYRAAMVGHVEAIIELMQEGAL